MKNLKIKSDPLLSNLFQLLVFIVFAMFFSAESNAQVAYHGSVSYTNVRSNSSLKNKEPRLGYNLGLAIQYYPIKKFKNISVINELNFNRKGYQQDFEKNYRFEFYYLSFPVLVNYSLSDNIAVHTGVELSTLVATNVEYGRETYNNFDLGLVFGFSFLTKKRISCYSRLTYGVVPMLDYYEIDELGNFKGKIHDLKNICLSIGIKFNIYNEKIRLYK